MPYLLPNQSKPNETKSSQVRSLANRQTRNNNNNNNSWYTYIYIECVLQLASLVYSFVLCKSIIMFMLCACSLLFELFSSVLPLLWSDSTRMLATRVSFPFFSSSLHFLLSPTVFQCTRSTLLNIVSSPVCRLLLVM